MRVLSHAVVVDDLNLVGKRRRCMASILAHAASGFTGNLIHAFALIRPPLPS
jgi:hypothetical protein